MLLDTCPNCNIPLSFFNFCCGSDVQKESICLNCDYCSYTFLEHESMISRIKKLLGSNKKFIVNCHDQIAIENFDGADDGHYNTGTTVKLTGNTYPYTLAKAPSLEEIRAELNKKYELKLDNIVGFDDIKNLIRETVNVKNKKKVNLLIAGYPGTAKTVFLLSIKDELEQQGANCHYIDCANLTGAGIMDLILTVYVNDRKKIDFLLLDEIDKVDTNHQRSFLNMLQTGIVKSTKKSDMRETKTNFSAIATANDINKIYKALFDRFLCVYVPAYDRDQFFSIGEAILQKKYHFSKNFAKIMTLKVWQTSRSMRRIDDIATLITDEPNDQMRLEKLELVIQTLEKRKIS